MKLIQPTDFTGVYPTGWAGYTWLDFDAGSNAYHPGDDYNWGSWGQADFDRPVLSIANALVVHTSRLSTGYGNIVILEMTLDTQLKDLIRSNYPKYQIKSNKVCVLFAHLNRIYVTTGSTVTQGQLVATIGNSGTVYSHLHAEMYEPNGDLMTLPYRFYPVGWSKDKIEINYLPIFTLIEKSKQVAPPTPNADEYVSRLTQALSSAENAIVSGEQVGDPMWKQKNGANKAKLLSLATRL